MSSRKPRSRLLAHALTGSRAVAKVFTESALDALEERIGRAERGTSGQIRLAVEANLPLLAVRRGFTARARGLEVFSQLHVWDTEHNNGVLIYLLMAERKVEILADRGIDRAVGHVRWQKLVSLMENRFSKGDFVDGIGIAIDRVGDWMREFYSSEMTPNEQSDRPHILK